MRILGWNVLGITPLGRSAMIRWVTDRCNPIVLGLVDTRHSRLTDEKVKGWWKKEDNVSWVDVPETCSNDKKSGGLVFSWNELLFSKSKVLTNKRYILVEGKLIQERIDVSFLLVHAPSCSQERFDLWKDLMNLKKSISTPLMMFGDFNEVLEPEEIKGNEVTTQGMKDFRHCIGELNLVELPLLDKKFTWYVYDNNCASRTDRFFVDQEWLEHFKVLNLRGLERMVADHRPLLVQFGSVDDITSICGTYK